MLYPFNQNWRTSQKPFTLSLANAVNTGVSFDTPSGTIANQKAWASAGFRGLGRMHGYGPTMTFPGGSGLDGHGCGCGCSNGGGGNLLLYALAGVGIYLLLEAMMSHRGGFPSLYGE